MWTRYLVCENTLSPKSEQKMFSVKGRYANFWSRRGGIYMETWLGKLFHAYQISNISITKPYVPSSSFEEAPGPGPEVHIRRIVLTHRLRNPKPSGGPGWGVGGEWGWGGVGEYGRVDRRRRRRAVRNKNWSTGHMIFLSSG